MTLFSGQTNQLEACPVYGFGNDFKAHLMAVRVCEEATAQAVREQHLGLPALSRSIYFTASGGKIAGDALTMCTRSWRLEPSNWRQRTPALPLTPLGAVSGAGLPRTSWMASFP